jgi:hypothetical protein
MFSRTADDKISRDYAICILDCYYSSLSFSLLTVLEIFATVWLRLFASITLLLGWFISNFMCEIPSTKRVRHRADTIAELILVESRAIFAATIDKLRVPPGVDEPNLQCLWVLALRLLGDFYDTIADVVYTNTVVMCDHCVRVRLGVLTIIFAVVWIVEFLLPV